MKNTARILNKSASKNTSSQAHSSAIQVQKSAPSDEWNEAGLIYDDLIEAFAEEPADMRLNAADGFERLALAFKIGAIAGKLKCVDDMELIKIFLELTPAGRMEKAAFFSECADQLRKSVRLMRHGGLSDTQQLDSVNGVLWGLYHEHYKYMDAGTRMEVAKELRRRAQRLEASAILLRAVEELNLPGSSLRN